jgi:hypothetical protein
MAVETVAKRRGAGQDVAQNILTSRKQEFEAALAPLWAAELQLDAFSGAWTDEVFTVNVDMDAVVVKTGEGQWQVAKLCIDMSRRHFPYGSIAICSSGFVARELISELVPMENIVLEPLHLLIQTGSTWIEVTRNVLQYLSMPDGTPRDISKPESAARAWERARSGARQSLRFTSLGLDFEKLIEIVLAHFKPITNYHGEQVTDIHDRRHLLWAELAESLRLLDAAHPADSESPAAGIVGHLKGFWKTWLTFIRLSALPCQAGASWKRC